MPADLPTQLRGLTRARAFMLGLAVAVPMLLGAAFDRQIRRLEALADHGREATGIVTRVQGGGSGITFYEYTVAGASHAWNVKRADAPFAPGVTFPVTYLPEDPSFSRPGEPPSGALAEAAGNRIFTRRALMGISAFFLLNAALIHAKLRKVRRDGGTQGATGPLVSPVVLGRILAVVFLLITLGVNLDDQVRIVQEKAFGVAPFGLPVTYVVILVQAVLFAPFFSVTEHLVRIVQRALADGASISRVGLLVYLTEVRKQHPELVRSRNIVLAGLAYFVVLMAGWIAFAAAKGI